ncbi:MAG: filamentous hemagglutinin family protein [Steroidobacteraceae bacterium]
MTTDYLTSGGFTRTEIYSNDTVTIPKDTALTLLPGSSLKIRAGQVDVDANITAASGTLDFASITTARSTGTGVQVADNVTLDVSGLWINDTETSSAALPSTTLFQNAGSISLATATVDSDLLLGSKVQLLADGGAWLKRNGKLSGGKGGSISLLSNGQNSSFVLGNQVGLSAYGVNGADGGSFSLAAGRLQLVNADSWAGAQGYTPDAMGGAEFLRIGSGLFTNYGFSKFTLTASGGTAAIQGDALQVASGTQINAVIATRQLNADYVSITSGGKVGGFSTVTSLPVYERDAASITLGVTPYAGFNDLVRVGALEIQQGALITGDAGTKIALNSAGGNINVDGALIAHAGSIEAKLAVPTNTATPYDADLQLRIGSQATLDVSGTAIMTPNSSGLLQGEVLDGGALSLVVDRGSLLLEHGAQLNASGTAATLDVAARDGYQRQWVASDAGSIALTASEAIGIYGDLQAKAGVGSTGKAMGGTLSVNLTRENAQYQYNDATAPTNDVVLELTDAKLPDSTGTLSNGLAQISTTQIAAAGIDDLRLGSEDVIALDAGVNLTVQRRVQLDAPATRVAGSGTANINAPYVLIGNSANNAITQTASGGTGVLTVKADQINVLGSSVVQNVDQVTLISSGDIRLRGTVQSKQLSGDLSVDADLKLQAARVYAATATQFDINALDHTIDIEQDGTATGTPLSAASSLSINAADIVQNGTVLAPFGSIALNATETLTLGAGSLTSVSANGALIPYGSTEQNGVNWIYSGTGTAVDVDELPARQITLNSDQVNIAGGATVDMTGGGDLYAYEWVPGTGGSKDALSNANTSNMYAIVPALGSSYAPYDDELLAGSSLQAGDTVYLSGVSGLAAGYYTLLPARYALLPGAYLISEVSGFSNLLSGATTLADGTPVTAGYYSFGNTGLGGTSYTGFAVYPGSWGRELAEYSNSYASSFFDAGLRQTINAGQLSIIAGTQLNALGTVKSAAINGGTNATIDIAANKLEIVGTLGAGSSGTVQLDDTVLNSWNAGSLLLGGTHSADGSSIAVNADTVQVNGDAHLAAAEVTLVARDQVSIAAGGSVKSNSVVSDKAVTLPDARTITLTGTGATTAALVSVSDLGQMELERTGSAGATQGVVSIASGASLTTRGALTVAAPGGTQLDGSLGGVGASWLLDANQVAFDANNSNGRLTITDNVLAAMQSADALHISSAGSIDFNKQVTLGTAAAAIDDLTLSATSLRNTAGQSVSLYADALSLQGIGAVDEANKVLPSSGMGSLNLFANNIEVSNAELDVAGFAQTNMVAAGQVAVADNGTLLTGGDLNLTAARISARSASDGELAATGNVSLMTTTAAVTQPDLELGGGLTISGTNIVDNASIIAPSAVVILNAGNQLTLGDQAVINVSGTQVAVDDIVAYSDGGAIKLSAGGDVSTAAGSLLSVAGSHNADAGALIVAAGGQAALQGNLIGSASSNETGASFELQADSLSDFAGLNARLQTAGFNQEQSIHVAQGDLTLAAGTTTRAHDVNLVTDNGAINVVGAIVAASTDGRGSIRLYANNGVTLTGTGELHADGSTTDGRGGNIELGTSGSGVINLQQGGVITATGAEKGSLLLRAPAVNGNDIAIGSLNSDVTQAGTVTLEAVLTPYDFSSAPSTAQWNAIKTTATNYINAATSVIANRLNAGNTPSYLLTPGIEIQSSGDLDLNALDLSTWRFNGAPAALTVRAAGSLNINGTISDGFKTSGTGTSQFVYAMDDASASIRLIAGGNLLSADPLAVIRATTADLTIAAGQVVRTGTGDLSLVAAQDVIFAGAKSSAYTGGTNAITRLSGSAGATISFLTNGGQLSINAGRDVNGYAMQQSVTEWQSRQGSTVGSTTTLTAWGQDIRKFNWNAGTLGGGDLSIKAGNDINQLSAAAADSAMESSNKDKMSYFGGGTLDVAAGNDINSGLFYVAQRTGSISADGAVAGGSWGDYGNTSGILLAMGNAAIEVNARSGVSLAGVVNPTLMYQATRLSTSTNRSYFSTYGSDSSLQINASSGDVALDFGLNDSALVMLGLNASDTKTVGDALSFLPPSLSIQALEGDISGNGVGETFVLAPDDQSQLQLFAAQDIHDLNLIMSDSADSKVPAALSPKRNASIDVSFSGVGQWGSMVRHADDTVPVSVAAGEDIKDVILAVPKAIEVRAGRDITDLTINAQNLRATDDSTIIAGRDLTFTSTGHIWIAGPGAVTVVAGRDIDLGVSNGIYTDGSLRSANIRNKEGADLTVMAGMAADWDVPTFISDIVAVSPGGAAALIDYVQTQTGRTGLTLEQAITAFGELPVDQQRPFVLRQFYGELVASGREANDDASVGYSRAYAAINALLPGNRNGENAYDGDLNMIYSRIYTLAGGDINLFVPGGGINVGLAVAPKNSSKGASELGIVAQKTGDINIFANNDVLVNSSRIFTLLGGNIDIWSTVGNIDAGKGAKSSLSAPAPVVLVDSSGQVTLDFSGAVAGSGIRTIQTDKLVAAGNVDLIAPAGYVNAGDAGIGAAGNINIAAKQVIGVDNIQVGGVSTGVPAATSGLAASLSGVSAVASGAANSSSSDATEDLEEKKKEVATPLAQTALSWLEVFVVGLGEDNCKQDDVECLKRQK